ncbi:phosducin family protein [Histoplasma capsulatum var. duboisii H88]|uniref:Phosducin family protein n=2 Tax=Ajellomyces capsulatus TaxID=5037 RepID=A0A8H8D6N6_AJECA|nr:phosducin family protein [Histoplasma capsulatum]QSS51214.1 phosducin family protein [Histoplasma capsulatum var. duboisii H88]QSS69213.1 phosducin family protein [Histoplasma capsulatum G186AR]
MDMPVNVPVDNPNADTEWNDILRKHGIIPEKPPSPTPIIEEALLEAAQREHENRLENKTLDELDALEDEEEAEFLAKYRKQRFEEMSLLQKTSIHNQVYPLQKPDYAKDVTEASSKYFVLVNLTSSSVNNIESQLLTELWRQLAMKYGDIKFCEIRADMCIEGYPDRNTPTILAYKDGDIKRQLVTLKELRGPKTTLEDLEKLLVSLGAINENDSRLRQDPTPKPADSDDEYLDDWD